MPDAYLMYAKHGYTFKLRPIALLPDFIKSSTQVNNPLYTNFLESKFKTVLKKHHTIRQSVIGSITKPITSVPSITNIKLLLSFKSYLRLNTASASTITIPHFSFKYFYLGYRRGGVALLNVNKFFTRWKDVYYLMFNLFYYELDLLTFGTSFFKNEILSINWQSMSRFKFMWRYTRPFFALRPNKITTYGDFVFYRLNLLGLRVGLIIDVLYHSKTIYYLHRSGFYTVGLVPVNYNINSVSFAIPSTSDSLLTQVFFLRFTTLIQQNTAALRFKSTHSLWLAN